MANLELDEEREMTEDEQVEYVNQLKEALGITDSESKDDLVFLFPPIGLSDEELTVMCNSKEWQDGFNLGAYYGGFNTALINNGMDVNTAGTIVATEHAMRVNIETQKIINEGIKMQSVVAKKSQL